MSDESFLSTSSLSPRKAVLIIVLVVVLGIVLFGTEPASTDSAPSPPPRSSRAITQTALQAETSDAPVTAQWPEFSLQSVLQTNPFETILVAAPQPQLSKLPEPERPLAPAVVEPKAVPTAAAKSAPETAKSVPEAAPEVKQQSRLEHRPHEKVDIIYENETERVAVIESQLVRVGDVLSEGRVVAITPDNVIIEAILLVE